MATVLTDALTGAILDNVADVIEGGNSYNGGTIHKGIPGRQSHGELEQTLSVIQVDSNNSITTVGDTVIGGSSLVSGTTPPWFVVCSGGNEALNDGAGRKISSYTAASAVVLTAAFPATLSDSDTYVTRQGFKRAPDNYDIEDADAGSGGGFDRVFDVSALPGQRIAWYGNGIEHYETELVIRLRILKSSRARKAYDSAFENLMLFRSILTRSEHRSNGMQLLDASSSKPSEIANDIHKVVLSDTYRLVYRINSTFL